MREVSELSQEANRYVFSPQISFRRWAHVLKSMNSQAHHYEATSDWENAYILYLRWADLLLNKLPTHPEFKANKHKYESLTKQLNGVLKRAEQTKAVLSQRLPETELSSDHTSGTSSRQSPTPSAHFRDRHHFFHRSSRESSPAATALMPHVPDSLADSDIKTLKALRQNITVKTPEPNHAVAQTQHYTQLQPSHPAAASHTSHRIHNHTEGGEPLRTLFIPERLEQKFLNIAEPNTRKRLETCGILCGKLSRNALFVTDLIIPHQESTENSCSTTNEEELFDYVESKDLFIVGWIHTHPTQTCFMSSVDLHTHNSYQIMLPEAVAIVCAPQYGESGAFQLTDPPGVDIIKKCHQTGFHPHHEDKLYKKVLPGHVRKHEYDFVTKDLR